MGKRNIKDIAYLYLLNEFLNKNAFTYLRTTLNLGYVVGAGKVSHGNVYGVIVLVQGNKETPDKVDVLIEDFLRDTKQDLEDLNFEDYKQSAITII